MKYVAKDIGEVADISSGNENQNLEFIKLISLSVTLIVGIYFSTVFLSEYFISGISVEDEKKWFGQVNMFSVDRTDDKAPSNELNRANLLLARIIKHSEVPELPYKLFVIDKKELNAFAFPGGNIGVTNGLLEQLKDDSALAFVLAHELGHFKHRHHLKGFSKAFGLGIIFSMVLGSESDLMLTENILMFFDARHSQKQEVDSDEFSVRVVYVYFDVL